MRKPRRVEWLWVDHGVGAKVAQDWIIYIQPFTFHVSNIGQPRVTRRKLIDRSPCDAASIFVYQRLLGEQGIFNVRSLEVHLGEENINFFTKDDFLLFSHFILFLHKLKSA